MKEVGVRELKSRLSQYLHRAATGERILVTERGHPFVLLTPAEKDGLRESLTKLLGAGEARWAGGKPQGARRPHRLRSKSLSQTVLDDR
ncbi:MAG: antitoxin [Nitrospirales bacterium]|nr:MAG: antitoxin [Nitrospirales bacterium]